MWAVWWAGTITMSIGNSHSDSTVIGAGNGVGGLAGYSLGSIFRSHATGAVSGNERVGGLVGNNKFWLWRKLRNRIGQRK